MSMTATILSLAVTYAVVLAILIAILVRPRIPPVGRIGAALLAGGLFLLTYYQVGELRGLPSDSSPPSFFKLHWARVVEPNQMLNESGKIFLWLEALDEDNYPSGQPRAYLIPYSEELVTQVEVALNEIRGGAEVAGRTAEEQPAEDTAERLSEAVAERTSNRADPGVVGEKVLTMDFGNLSFVPMPAPITPEKPL